MSTDVNALVVVSPLSIGGTGAFARASTATYVGSNGLIQTAAINVPRFAYDPVTLESAGLLLEEQRGNLLTYSEDLSNAVWTKASGSIASNTIAAPDGNLTADAFIENTVATQFHFMNYPVTKAASTITYTFSTYVKDKGRIVGFAFTNGSNGAAGNFNPSTAVMSGFGVFGTGFTAISATAAAVGNGWYRLSFVFTVDASILSFIAQYSTITTGTTNVYTGDGYSGFYAWGAQLELGSVATSYIPTVAAAVTRAADVVSGTGLVYSNVPETDYTAWSAATTYALGARAIVLSTHKIYESLQASNLNKDPLTQPLWWIEVSPTNRWKLFDSYLSSSTAQATNITYVIKPGQAINAIAALNVQNATKGNIRVYSPYTGISVPVYSESVDFNPLPAAPDWWSFFYGDKIEQTQAIKINVPSYTDCIVEIELIGGAALSVGSLIMGQQRAFGLGIKYGARVGIQDYSRKETNEFGDTILVQRAFAKRANFDMLVEKAEVDSLQNFLSSVRATICLWIGSGEYEATTIYGFYKNFDILINYPEHADCELEIEGLT